MLVKRIQKENLDIFIVRGKLGLLECTAERKNDILEINLSSRYGCKYGCKYCNVTSWLGDGKNCTVSDFYAQIKVIFQFYFDKKILLKFDRMGEPTLNFDIKRFCIDIKKCMPAYDINLSLSTIIPKDNKKLIIFLNEWFTLSNSTYNRNNELELSINFSDEELRTKFSNDSTLDLKTLSLLFKENLKFSDNKVILKFFVTKYDIDYKLISYLFSPRDFMIKLLPLYYKDFLIEDESKFLEHKKNFENVGFNVVIEQIKKENANIELYLKHYDDFKV